MSIRPMEGGAENRIPVNNVLVSVSDKTELDQLVNGLFRARPNVRILATGGTYKHIAGVLGYSVLETEHGQVNKDQLLEVGEYTGCPEMDGGLVKTLQPKVFAGILGERNNKKHQTYLRETLNDGVFIDVAVVNLYPVQKTIAEAQRAFENREITFAEMIEKVRGNIDVGGPSMARAGAKNFMSCATICDPNDYAGLLRHIKKNEGCTTRSMRAEQVVKVFAMTTAYDRAIEEFFGKYSAKQISGAYKLKK